MATATLSVGQTPVGHGGRPSRTGRTAGGSTTPMTFWQHPFVDVFRKHPFADVSTAERKGDVSEVLDKHIGKQVFRLKGAVSANNYIRLPHSKSPNRSLGLTGEYVYLQMKDMAMKFFVVHLDFTVASVNVLRVTLSNMYSEVKVASHTVQCPCYVTGTWSIVCVHVPSVLAMCVREKPHAVPHAFVLKSMQFCSSLLARNVFTSDIRYTPDSLPREMLFDQQGDFEERYAWFDVPGPFAKDMDPSYSHIVPTTRTIDESTSEAASPLRENNGARRIAKINPARSELEKPSLEESGEMSVQGRDSSLMNVPQAIDSSPAVRLEESSVIDQTYGVIGCSGIGGGPCRIPDPMLEVSRLVGVSKKNRRVTGLDAMVPRRFAVFVRAGAGDSSSMMLGLERGDINSGVLHASSMTLTTVDPATQAQRYFFGHSRPIELVEASDDGLWVCSVQGADSGAPPLVRLWRVDPRGGSLQCKSVLSCPSLSAVRVASFCPLGQYLAFGGTDMQNRQQIMVWDLRSVLAGNKPELLARQTSADWDIDCIKFSPWDELQLVTCGYENIRFWRVKDANIPSKKAHLPGRNVVLNALSRQSHFTCIAFEFNKMGQPYFLGEHLAEHQRVFVGTAKGKVLQLAYKDLKVQVVFQLHNEAITSMCANEGFVVTASADGYVRVWPLDFKSFYLHAMHDAPVVGVDITVDGMQVLCCTADGSVGILDMQGHNYVDVVRSHGAAISDAAVSLFFEELVSVSCDGTIKVWSLATMLQTHEFNVSDDVPMVVAFHPGERHHIAVGFQSGSMRVFDVDGPALLCQHRHHLKPVVSILFVSDASAEQSTLGHVRIITCDTSGALAIHDEAAEYEVVRTPEGALCSTPPERCPAIVCRPPRLMQYRDPQSVILCTFPGLEMVRRLRVASSTVTALDFSFDGQLATLCTADSQLFAFSAGTGEFIITYSFASGPVTACALAASDDLPPVLLIATVDARLRLSQLRTEELDTSDTSAAEAALAAAGYSNQVPPPVSGAGLPALHAPLPTLVTLPRGRFDEQSFIGHSTAPHRILITAQGVVTVSANEIICWGVAGEYLHKLFNPATRPAETEAQSEVEDPTWHTQQMESESSPSTTLLPTTSTAHPNTTAPLATLRPPDSVCSSSSSLPVRDPRMETSVEALISSDATITSRTDPETIAQVGDVGGSADKPDNFARAPPPELDLTEERFNAYIPPEQNKIAIEADPSLAFALEASRSYMPRNARDSRLGFELVGLSGCACQFGHAALTWNAELGILCHTVGNAVHVEEFGIAQLTPAQVPGEVNPCRLARTPGLEAFALDLRVDGLLAVMSGAPPEKQGEVWLSLWSVDDITQEAAIPLPDGYAAHWSRYRAALPEKGSHHEAPPLMRILPGSPSVVTTATIESAVAGFGFAFRVDVWDFDGNGCSLRCSAELGERPMDLTLLADFGNASNGMEFITLCAHALIFWRIPSAEEVGEGQPALLHQLAEKPESWAYSCGRTYEGTCMSIVTTPDSRRFLFVGTSSGSVWVYDADHNSLEGEMSFVAQDGADDGPVGALACSHWPFLLCAKGATLRIWILEADRLGHRCLTAVAAGEKPILLDGQISSLRLGGVSPWEGVVATAANTVWYFDAREGIQVPLHQFHDTPSRILRSNSHLLAGRDAVTEVLATAANDGSIRIWSSDVGTTGPAPRAIAQFAVGANAGPGGVCTAMSFLRSDLLICGFAGGGVAVCSLGDLTVVARLDPFEASTATASASAKLDKTKGSTPKRSSGNDQLGGIGDPVLALEASGVVDEDSVIVGSGSGRLVQLTFDLKQTEDGVWSMNCLKRAKLPRSRFGSAVCRIQSDSKVSPTRFLVCFDNLEVWLLQREQSGSSWRHTQTWPWPESEPRIVKPCEVVGSKFKLSTPDVYHGTLGPPLTVGCTSARAALEILASPPIVACFGALDFCAADLVAVAATGASWIYVYSCDTGTIVHRVNMQSKFEDTPVLQMIPMSLPPPPPGSGHDRLVDDEVILVLCADRFARLALGQDKRHAQWLEEPVQIPGGFRGRLPGFGGTPDACLLEDTAQGAQMLLVKSDSALSCWTLQDHALPSRSCT